ncbi:uncharacterized protein [Amphiura filiformis]|uniref:uncharacterized protein n=1 Tax=Amphiura filiformis TaxID=82378 RepID=UPI003B2262CF
MALQDNSNVDTCSEENAQVTIKDDDDEFYFEGIKYKVKESDKQVEVTIVRCGYLGMTSSICVSTQSGSAQPTSDYTQVTRHEVSYAVNQKAATVSIAINQDNISEDDEEFHLVLEGCTGTTAELSRLGHPQKVAIWIKNTFECTDDCEDGECIAEDTCECVDGYTGAVCDIPVCDPVCVNGDCDGVNYCKCDFEWTGDACDIPFCNPSCVNGVCVRNNGINRCECSTMSTGWYGNRCNIAVVVITLTMTVIEFPPDNPLIYTPDLNDPTSQGYMQMKDSIAAALRPVFQALVPSFIDINPYFFSPGSVHVVYQLILDTSNDLSPSEINQILRQRVQLNGELDDSGLILEETDPLVALRCPICYNGGTCAESVNGYNCVCLPGYTGSQCLTPIPDEEEETGGPTTSASGLSDGALAGIIIGAVVGFLFLVVLGLLGLCVYKRSGLRKPAEKPLQLYPHDGVTFGVNPALQNRGFRGPTLY